MNLSVGIIGLPNVGKSILFNALLKKQQALVANYPFATIEPNVGVVPVPDERLEKLAIIVGGGDPYTLRSEAQNNNLKLPPIVSATVKFLDIAGLVKGASEGVGLGNKFLSHIREVSIIAHVVRAFSDENVIREGSIDPKSDYQTIETELMIADLQTVQNVQSRIKRFSEPNEKSAVDKLFKALNEGTPAREVQLTEEEKVFADQLFLLSAKPEILVLNVSEEDYTEEKTPQIIEKYKEIFYSVISSETRNPQQDLSSAKPDRDEKFVVICAKIESELSELSEEEQREYLRNLGLKESGLERLIKKAYQTLGLISFLTAGEKEVRAWTIRLGSTSLVASGTIHTDFMKNFIKAEVVSFEDFVQFHGWKGAREKGKARFEGRDYIVKDGDVIEFKIGK